VEAWWFQVTRETETVVPSPTLMESPLFKVLAAGGDDFADSDLAGWLLVLATNSGRTVVFDPAENKDSPLQSTSGSAATADPLLDVLQANGYRILEQEFPRRAYIVIRDTP
jgi:hypothetical protein